MRSTECHSSLIFVDPIINVIVSCQQGIVLQHATVAAVVKRSDRYGGRVHLSAPATERK